MTNTYLILTKAKWESALPVKLKTADRLSWNEYTYRDEERSATRNVNVDLPTDDNLKNEITAFMDTYSIDYSSSDTKSELIEKIDNYTIINGVPQEEETYTYTEQVVDTTTLQNPTWKESAFKLGKLGSPRWNKDGTKVLVKYELPIADGTLDVVKDTSGITALSHSEAIEEMKKDEWVGK
jgi:hypothetical protein